MPEDADATQIPALLLDRYRIEETLGHGGFGIVVKAFDTRLRRYVAVKSLQRSPAVDDQQFAALEERFAREAEAAARMGVHPHLVAVYDVASDPAGVRYLFLEYVPGGTLATRLMQERLPPREALRYIADAADGLHAAHEVGIVHRDVKPANLFLTAAGRVKVGDFGVAQIDDLSGRTRTTVGHPGTPLYMSPEQSATTGYLQSSSDQYSLGLVLFEMLTGKAYHRLAPRDAAALLAEQSPPVATLLRRMLADNPSDRYATMADVRDAIADIPPSLAARTVAPTIPETPPPTLPPAIAPPQQTPPIDLQPYSAILEPPRQASPRYRRRAVLAGSALVTIGGAAGALALLRGHGGAAGATATPITTTTTRGGGATSPSPTPPAPTPTRAAVQPSATPAPPTFGALLRTLAGHTDSVLGVAIAPNGKMLASGSFDKSVLLWRVADGSRAGQLIGHSDLINGVAIGPESVIVASASRDRTIRLWNSGDSALLRTITGHTDEVFAVAFAPSGMFLISGSADKSVRLWRVADGALVRTIIGHTDAIRGVAYSPDGQLFASASSDQSVRLWRESDGALVRILRGHTDEVENVAFSPDRQIVASASADKTIRLWRVADGTFVRALTGHTDVVWGVAFAPDGQTLASGGKDKTIRLWHIATGTTTRTLTGHTDEVNSVAFTPDGSILASGSSDQTVRL